MSDAEISSGDLTSELVAIAEHKDFQRIYSGWIIGITICGN